MTARPVRRSSLFLLELMTAILLFCLCAGYCVRMFVRAHEVSTESAALTHAVRQCSNAAELFRSAADYRSAFAEEYPDGVWTDDTTFEIRYDKDWRICSAEETNYLYMIQITIAPGAVVASDVPQSTADTVHGAGEAVDSAPISDDVGTQNDTDSTARISDDADTQNGTDSAIRIYGDVGTLDNTDSAVRIYGDAGTQDNTDSSVRIYGDAGAQSLTCRITASTTGGTEIYQIHAETYRRGGGAS